MKVGDFVNAAYVRGGVTGIYHSGIIVDIEEVDDLFSEKYAIVETNTYVRVLANGDIMTFELEGDKIEVINESR